jgi:hypothetical protein
MALRRKQNMDSLTEKYKILNIYKEDKYQEITLAVEKENHEKIVILNILQKKFLPNPDSLLNFRSCISSLVYSEETDNEIFLATTYKKGFPISKYIQYYKPILKTRINFVYEYLEKISSYDCLHIKLANSLVKESQIIIEENNVAFNDILIMDDVFEKNIGFNILCSSIHETLRLFIFGEATISEGKLKDLPNELQTFLNDLSINKQNYISLKEIFSAFKTIYLYNLYLDDKNSALLMEDVKNSVKSSKDVKNSVKSSKERPLPIYNPTDAFSLKQDNDINEKANVPEKESPNDNPNIESTLGEGVFLDDYMSGINKDSNIGPSIIESTDEVVLPGQHISDDTDDSDNMQTTEEITGGVVLPGEPISGDTDDSGDEQATEETTAGVVLPGDHIADDTDDSGDGQTTEEITAGVLLPGDHIADDTDDSIDGQTTEEITAGGLLPGDHIADDTDDSIDGQTTEEITAGGLLPGDHIADDTDDSIDGQTTEEITAGGLLPGDHIADDTDDSGDGQTTEEITDDDFYQEDEDDIPIEFKDFENDYAHLFKPIDSSIEPTSVLKTQKINEKDRKVIAIILIAALLGIILTVCNKTNLLFFKDNLPVATFQHERLYDEWIFQVDDSETVFQSYEWTVKQNGKDAISGSGSEFRFKETFLDEGEFTVSLRILDDENNWSQTYSNNYYNIINDIDTININPNSDQSKEQFDSLSVQFQDESSISKDDTVFRNGTYSLQISGNKQNEESKLTINNLVMDNNSVISMWILSDSTESFRVQLLGYNGKTLAFKRSVNFKPSSKNYWELLSVSQETNNVDRMEIVFSNMSSRIWIDDLDINSYK